MTNKVKIEYLPMTGYAGFVDGASLIIPTAGIYEVTEDQALYLVERFPDWFKFIEESKTSGDDSPPSRYNRQ